MGRNFKISMLIVGTVIGAGFASGKEICTFFLRFGEAAYGLAALSGLMFFGGFYLLLAIGAKQTERGVDAFHQRLFGRFAGVGIVILLLSNLLMTSSMLGAFDLIVPCDVFPVGGLIAAVAAFGVLMFGMSGLVRLNAAAVPLMTGMTVVIALYGVFGSTDAFRLDPAHGGLLRTLLYVGMNMLTLGGALSEFKMERKARFAVSATAALVISGLLFLEIYAIRACGTKAYQAEMPMLYIAESVGLGIPMRIVLALGIFTTLTATAHVNAQWLTGILPSRWLCLAGVLLVGWVISRFGFGNIVDRLYPLLGLAGLVIVAASLCAWVRLEWYAVRARVLGKLERFRRLPKTGPF